MSARRKRNKRNVRRSRRQPHADRAPRIRPPQTLGDRSPVAESLDSSQWDALRQGARNVAGVRYQLAVTALLLAESRRGELPFLQIVPEGIEDIDCLDGESTRWLVQVKEYGAGMGTFTASAMAEVISHAASGSSPPARIVAITDGQLRTQLVESGWTRAISETPGCELSAVETALMRRGHRYEETHRLLARTHLVTLPWNTIPHLTRSIADTYNVKPAVAGLIACRLVDTIGQIAADQRGTTHLTSGRFCLTDLDRLVNETLSVVDVDALDSAIRLGVCEIADYSAKPAIGLSGFLQGIDALPAHIGANLDIIRPVRCREVQRAIETTRYALIAGPSGAGKSTQMWRSARDIATAAQVLRVRRIETHEDVEELVRYIKILAPSDTNAVVVCCDDIGRPQASKWPVAAQRLLELPGVVLLGAVRQEDFTATLLRHGGRLVELTLDDQEASAIGNQLAAVNTDLRLELTEAVRLADGQLMEFVSLLTTGHRICAVLSDQAESIIRDGDQVPIGIARLVCASHTLGLALDASCLSSAVPHNGPSVLAQALLRLQNEHIITDNKAAAWTGLHQVRSEILTDLFHKAPPPTLAETLSNIFRLLHPSAVWWGLRRAAELFGDQIAALPDVVPNAVEKCLSARDVAVLLEGLERADHSWTAREYVPIIERHRHRDLALMSWSMFVCAKKLTGFEFSNDGQGQFAEIERRVRECSDELPRRCSVYCDRATDALGVERLVNYILGATLDDAVRLLEAVAPYQHLSAEALRRIADVFVWPSEVQSPERCALYGRFLASCRALASAEVDFAAIFGSTQDRLAKACRIHPNVTSVRLSSDGTRASVELLGELRQRQETVSLPWDGGGKNRSDDQENRHAVELAVYVGDCCADLEVIEIRTVRADGEPLVVGTGADEWEPGHKRLARETLPKRLAVRINVGVRGAMTRQIAAFSWTELTRARESVARTVVDLLVEAPRRLSPRDHRRRRMEWCANLEVVVKELANLPAPPVEAEWTSQRVAASWDDVPSEDLYTDGIRSISNALQGMVGTRTRALSHVQIAAQLGSALMRLNEAWEASDVLTTNTGNDVYDRLRAEVARLRSLLVAISLETASVDDIKGSPDRLRDVVDGMIERAVAARRNVEERALEAVFGDVEDLAIEGIVDEDLFPISIVGHQWIVLVPPEGWEEAASVARNVDPDAVRVPVTLVGVANGRILPIALRPSATGRGLIPLPFERIELIAKQLGRSIVAGETQRFFAEVLEELVVASWKAARRRLRPREWGSIEEMTAEEYLMRVEKRLTEESRNTDMVTILGKLSDQVREESSGHRMRPLAAAVAAPLREDGSVAEADGTLELIVRGRLVALDEELMAVRGAAGQSANATRRG